MTGEFHLIHGSENLGTRVASQSAMSEENAFGEVEFAGNLLFALLSEGFVGDIYYGKLVPLETVIVR